MSRNRRLAFGIAELLAVLAITGILAAALFPVFAQARTNRLASCLSSFERLGAAQTLYAQDYDEAAVPAASALDPYFGGRGIATDPRARMTSTDACRSADPSGRWVSAGGGCEDTATGVVWSASGRLITGHGFSYPQAQSYCGGLNTSTGYTGWSLASFTQHQTAYTNRGAGYINNPSLFTEWTSTTYPGQGKYRKQTFDRAFDWSSGAETDIMIQDPYGTYSYADVLCVRQGQ